MRVDYVTVEEAIPLPGLRIAFTKGVPGPWSEACRAIFDLKKIPYTPVTQVGGEPNEALKAWTGQNSAPCAILDDERPRSHWSELLMLAERLGPEPGLIPDNEDLRIAMFGVLHEIAAEDGLGWSVRLLIFDLIEEAAGAGALDPMRRKFTSGAEIDHAKKRIATVLAGLDRRMTAQEAKGSSYLVGHKLSAADIYWTTFSNQIVPMAEAICPMPEHYRIWGTAALERSGAKVSERLLAHRDRIVAEAFQTPMWF